MYNQVTSISSSYSPKTQIPQAFSDRSESAEAPISVYYNWPELENVSIKSVLLRKDPIGDFARNWYKSACAIIFQPYNSNEGIIVGTGSLIEDNTVRTAWHVFENGDGHYYCRFFDFNNNQTSFLDRSILGDVKQAKDGVDLADIPLKSLNKNYFQKFCKVIHAVNDNQHPEGHVVMFHFANGEFKLSVAYVDADYNFTFQQRVFAVADDGASGAGLIWQQLDGTVSIGAHSVNNRSNNLRAIIQAAQFNTCFHLPTPETAPYHSKYDQSKTLAKGPNGEGPEFIRYYMPDDLRGENYIYYLNALFKQLFNHINKLPDDKIVAKFNKNIKFTTKESLIKDYNWLRSQIFSNSAKLIPPDFSKCLQELCDKVNDRLGANSDPKTYLDPSGQWITLHAFPKLSNNRDCPLLSLYDSIKPKGYNLDYFNPDLKNHLNQIPVISRKLLPPSFRVLINKIYESWKSGIVFDERLNTQLKTCHKNSTKKSKIPGAMRSSHQNNNGVLPNLNLKDLNQNSELYRRYCETQLNSGSSNLSSTPTGYVEYTINAEHGNRLVFDYVNGIFYISFTHYNFWENNNGNINPLSKSIPQRNNTYCPFFKLL